MRYLARDYTIIMYWSSTNRAYTAECYEIPSCVVTSENKQDAVKLVYGRLDEMLEYYISQGKNPPPPRSGKLFEHDKGLDLNAFLKRLHNTED